MAVRYNADLRVRELEQKASRLADQVIDRSYAGAYLLNLTFGVTKEGRSFPLIDAIDKLLQITPHDPDVLFAKAEIYSLLRDDETGQRLRREVLRLEPNHFDAYMREQHFRDWENIFTYPGWSEDMTKVPPVILAVQNDEQFVQIVRDGLTLTLAIFVGVNRQNFPRKVVDARWKPLWIDTPFGPIFPHYAMFRLPSGKIYRQEYSLSPYPLRKIHQRHGNWLIRRFCEVGSVFLVVNEGDDVIFNFRSVYTESVCTMLASVKERLAKVTLPSDHDTQVQRAMQWYMENSDIETILY
jgi:hypothetical protein